jgi:hypothetical protein
VRGSATPTRAHLIIKQASNVHQNGVSKLPSNTATRHVAWKLASISPLAVAKMPCITATHPVVACKLASTSHRKGVIMRALGGCVIELVIQIAGLCGVVRCGVGPVRLRLAKRSGRACV